MAVLNDQQVFALFETGNCEKFGLYAVKNVNSGDTYDMGPRFFRVINQTCWMEAAPASGAIVGSNNGTVVTIPNGVTAAGLYLLVGGIAP